MRAFIIFLTCMFLFSCTSTFVDQPGLLTIKKQDPIVYEDLGKNKMSQNTISLNIDYGDTLRYIGYLRKKEMGEDLSPVYKDFYLFENKNKKYFIDEDNAIDIIKQQKIILGGYCRLPRDREQEIWSKAISYVVENSEMKIQTQTDYVLETYNPTGEGKRGWTLNKKFDGDYVIIDAKCFVTGFLYNGTRQMQMLFYYLNTGEKMPETFFIY